MKLKLLIGAVIIAGLGFLAFLDAKTPVVDSASQLSEDQALGVVRTIGAAEATMNASYGKYGSLNDLIKANYIEFSDGFTMKDDNSGILKNYRLSIVPSPDGKHFQLSMTSTAACDTSVFTNESFAIYNGKPIGGCQQ
jgi:hypothetical protein